MVKLGEEWDGNSFGVRYGGEKEWQFMVNWHREV